MNRNNPYSNSQSPYSSSGFDKQREQFEQQQKQKYKFEAEKAEDNIVQTYFSAKQNGNDFIINEADKTAINRYYHRYWANDSVLISILILLISFGLSFYTNVSIFGILLVLVVLNSYSKNTYFTYFSNDHLLKSADEDKLRDIIFPNQLSMKTVGFLAIGLTLVSYITSFFTRTIYLDNNDPSIVIKALSYLKINFENELFAYFVAGSILILIFFKIFEKWSR